MGLLGTAIPYFFFALSSNPYVLGFGMFISGLGMLNLFSNVLGFRAVASPPRFRSRMFATASFLVAVSVPPGMWLTSVLLTALGPTALLLISGSFIVCSAMFVVAASPKAGAGQGTERGFLVPERLQRGTATACRSTDTKVMIPRSLQPCPIVPWPVFPLQVDRQRRGHCQLRRACRLHPAPPSIRSRIHRG
jgi:hypothetical protein